MKDKKDKSIAIQIGSGSARLIEIARVKDKLLVEKADAVEFQGDSSDQHQEGELFKALQELCSRNHLDGAQVKVVLSGEAAFVKVIKFLVPKGKGPDECLKAEVGKVLPFPEKDVLWDACVLGEESSGGPLKMLLIAIKKDALNLRMNALERIGPKVSFVSIAPVTLLNLALFEEKLEGKFFLMVNIEKNSADLIISKGSDILMRNLPYFGNAEELKKEITISLEHVKYEWALKDEEANPERMILTGDAENLAELRTDISSAFKADAHLVDTFKGIDISRAPTANEDAFAAAVGLALGEFRVPRFDINLVRSALNEKVEAKEKKLYKTASLVLIILIVAIGWILVQKQVAFKKEILSEITAATGQHKTQAEQAKTLKAERDLENEKMVTIVNEIKGRSSALQALAQISPFITSKVWLTQFDFSYAGFSEGKGGAIASPKGAQLRGAEENLKIAGYANSYDDLNNFINSLKGSAIFKKVQTISSKAKAGKVPDDGEVIEFGLALKVEVD